MSDLFTTRAIGTKIRETTEKGIQARMYSAVYQKHLNKTGKLHRDRLEEVAVQLERRLVHLPLTRARHVCHATLLDTLFTVYHCQGCRQHPWMPSDRIKLFQAQWRTGWGRVRRKEGAGRWR